MSPLYVLDCSVTMAWCFADEASVYADAALMALQQGKALVPSLWLLEISNVLLVAERRQRLQPQDSQRFLALLKTLPLEIYAGPELADVNHLVLLGRQSGLSAYDSVYLQLAQNQGLSLATQDRKLLQSAESVNVLIWTPERVSENF